MTRRTVISRHSAAFFNKGRGRYHYLFFRVWHLSERDNSYPEPNQKVYSSLWRRERQAWIDMHEYGKSWAFMNTGRGVFPLLPWEEMKVKEGTGTRMRTAFIIQTSPAEDKQLRNGVWLFFFWAKHCIEALISRPIPFLLHLRLVTTLKFEFLLKCTPFICVMLRQFDEVTCAQDARYLQKKCHGVKNMVGVLLILSVSILSIGALHYYDDGPLIISRQLVYPPLLPFRGGVLSLSPSLYPHGG
ncbi:hypothetical protein BDP67DRAFT_91999 [Colletotrichum lupini]|nr:hypothetical protein BDP67DRAFT_91999 [Colletotrichum lupini]